MALKPNKENFAWVLFLGSTNTSPEPVPWKNQGDFFLVAHGSTGSNEKDKNV